MRVVAVHNTRKVRPDEPFPAGEGHVDLAAAGNQTEIGQLVLHTDQGVSDLVISVTALRGPGGATLPVELLRQHYIHVERPTTPAFEAGWYPDALVPWDGPVGLEPGASLSVWVKVRVPIDQAPGHYEGTILVGVQEVPVRLAVWDFSLPVAGHCRTAFAVWYDQVADHHRLRRDSPEHWEMAERYYWFQVEQRLPPDDLPISSKLAAPDWLAAAERFLADPRVIAYRIPVRAADPTWTREIVEGLRRAGHLERGYFYLDEIDEPTAGGIEEPEGGLARVRELCAWLDELAPEVEHLVTAEPVPELEGAVRTWVPLFDRYDVDDSRRRRARGERFWWYGCVFPTHPYPNYHIDDDLMAARIVPWLMHRDGIEGNLYWATTIFGAWDGERFAPRDPWSEPMGWPGANGDGQLIYPGPDGPLSSIRLEAIRAGQDDFEYLWLLKHGLRSSMGDSPTGADAAMAVLAGYRDRLVGSAVDFARGAEVEDIRREIAEHIVRIRTATNAGVVVPTTDGPPPSSPDAETEAGALAVPRTPQPLRLQDAELEGWTGENEFGGDVLRLRTGPVGESRPWARWLVDGFRHDDAVVFELANNSPLSTALFVSFLRDDGMLHEAARVMVPAEGSMRFSVPVELSLLTPSRIVAFQIEVMPHQPGADLEVRAVGLGSPSPTARFSRPSAAVAR